MSCSPPDLPTSPSLPGVDRAAGPGLSGAGLSTGDLASACATRAALLAALGRLPEADPGDVEAAEAYGRVWDMVDEAERFILDQDPANLSEALAILDVLLEAEPQRSDGRDHRALRRIRERLRSETARPPG